MRRLRRLTEGLINALRVEEVVQVILDHGFDSIPELSVGAINLLTEDGVALRIAGMRGAPTGLVMSRERLLLSFDTPGTRSARTGEAVWLPTREAYLAAYPHLGGSRLPADMVQAVAAIPLQVERRVLGTLALTFHRPQSFALEEREFFMTLGRLCAQALDRARLYEEERSARHQLAAAATRLARLQRLTASLSEALTPLDIARVVVEEASALLGAGQALLVVASEDGHNLVLLGHHGLTPEAAERWAQFPTTAALPLATAYKICVPLWLESPEDIIEHYPRASGAGLETQALACVPLLVQGNPFGAIGFGFKAPRRFGEEDRALLGDLARQTAQALERARLYDAEQRAHSRLQVLADAAAAFSEHGFDLTAVVETATRMVSEELGDACILRLVSRDGRWLEPVAAYYPTPEGRAVLHGLLPSARQRTDQGLLQTVMERGETLYLPSVPRDALRGQLSPAYEVWLDRFPFYSVLVVPLVFKGRVLGTLGVVRHSGDRPLSREDRLLAEGIAARAALAIENARLYEAHAEARRQAERAAERTARLQAVTAALSEAVTPDDVARVMLYQAVSKVGGMAGVVFLVGEGGAELELLAASGYSDAVMAEYRRLPLVQPSPVCDAVIWGRALYFEDAATLTRSYPDARPPSLDLGGQALAVIPLVSPGGILGSLALRFAEERHFDAEERAFLQSMADQCAQALERARLYQREQKTRAEAEAARRRLEVLDQVSRLLAESQLDLQATCNAIARSVGESLGDLCLVLLLSTDGQRLEPVGRYHRDPMVCARVVDAVCKTPSRARGGLAQRVLGTGEPLLLPVVAPEELRILVHPDAAPAAEHVSVHSLLFVPIWSRQAVLGVLGITRDRPDRPYTLDDQRLLQQVADRAALAIENARLYSALRDNEARLAAILGSAMDAIVTIDERQRVVLFNTVAEYIFGISHGEALGQPIERFIPGGFPTRPGADDEGEGGPGPGPGRGHDSQGVLVARR
ncbi:MAG TPA: GAF domain-containing protein, partial [Polyangia bacterium]|nr:GAF domain-containing protein [Polyangia bacterium]